MKKSLFTTVAVAAVLVLTAPEGKGMHQSFRHSVFEYFREDYRNLDVRAMDPSLSRQMQSMLDFLESISAPVDGQVDISQLQYQSEDVKRKAFYSTWMERLFYVRPSGRFAPSGDGYEFPYFYRNRDALRQKLDGFKQWPEFQQFPAFAELTYSELRKFEGKVLLSTLFEQEISDETGKIVRFLKKVVNFLDDAKDTLGRSGRVS